MHKRPTLYLYPRDYTGSQRRRDPNWSRVCTLLVALQSHYLMWPLIKALTVWITSIDMIILSLVTAIKMNLHMMLRLRLKPALLVNMISVLKDIWYQAQMIHPFPSICDDEGKCKTETTDELISWKEHLSSNLHRPQRLLSNKKVQILLLNLHLALFMLFVHLIILFLFRPIHHRLRNGSVKPCSRLIYIIKTFGVSSLNISFFI